MSNTVIKVENLSKRYQLGTIGYGSLQHDLAAWWARSRGKVDPNTKIGEKSRLDQHGDFWALRGINFNVEQGDRLGIVGVNGAGKSTLLKLLSRVTAPTQGRILLKGKMASLLEVGTGFHPELTGRENVFLNGAILGMKRREIQKKFDEIVDFSGVSSFIDTPVKRYSSGMYVRLAFSVSAHLESEIMVIDEVLAVGDAEFQRQCLGKMREISTEEGRTILFVSHNIQAIKSLCNKGLLLEAGSVRLEGKVDEVVNEYFKNQHFSGQDANDFLQKLPPDPVLRLDAFSVTQAGRHVERVDSGLELEITLKYSIKQRTAGFRLFIEIQDEDFNPILRSFHDEFASAIPITEVGDYEAKAVIPSHILGPRRYNLVINAGVYNDRNCLGGGIIVRIDVENTGNRNSAYPNDTFREKLVIPFQWTVSSRG